MEHAPQECTNATASVTTKTSLSVAVFAIQTQHTIIKTTENVGKTASTTLKPVRELVRKITLFVEMTNVRVTLHITLKDIEHVVRIALSIHRHAMEYVKRGISDVEILVARKTQLTTCQLIEHVAKNAYKITSLVMAAVLLVDFCAVTNASKLLITIKVCGGLVNLIVRHIQPLAKENVLHLWNYLLKR